MQRLLFYSGLADLTDLGRHPEEQRVAGTATVGYGKLEIGEGPGRVPPPNTYTIVLNLYELTMNVDMRKIGV